VPGGPGRSSTYFDDLGGLSQDAELVLLDTRGSGESRPAEPTSLTVHRLVTDLAELCAHLGEKAPVLLGHSFGCRILLEYAAAHPDAVQGLILLTPPAMWESGEIESGRSAILSMREGVSGFGQAVEAARAIPSAGPRERHLLEAQAVPLWYGRWDAEGQSHAARAAAETPARTAVTLRRSAYATPVADLTTIDAPALLVAGQYDYVSPPGPIHALHERLPDSSYVELEEAGHYPWLDEPGLLRALIGDFLDGLPLAV